MATRRVSIQRALSHNKCASRVPPQFEAIAPLFSVTCTYRHLKNTALKNNATCLVTAWSCKVTFHCLHSQMRKSRNSPSAAALNSPRLNVSSPLRSLFGLPLLLLLLPLALVLAVEVQPVAANEPVSACVLTQEPCSSFGTKRSCKRSTVRVQRRTRKWSCPHC